MRLNSHKVVKLAGYLSGFASACGSRGLNPAGVVKLAQTGAILPLPVDPNMPMVNHVEPWHAFTPQPQQINIGMAPQQQKPPPAQPPTADKAWNRSGAMAAKTPPALPKSTGSSMSSSLGRMGGGINRAMTSAMGSAGSLFNKGRGVYGQYYNSMYNRMLKSPTQGPTNINMSVGGMSR